MTGVIYAFLAAIAWGAAYTLDQAILKKSSASMVLLFNAFLTIAIFLPTVSMDEIYLLRQDRRQLFLMLVTTFIGIFAGFCILKAIETSTASKASIIEISYPAFVILFSWIAYKQELGLKAMIGGLLVFAGSALIVSGEVNKQP